jgi:hypothetical protein
VITFSNITQAKTLEIQLRHIMFEKGEHAEKGSP